MVWIICMIIQHFSPVLECCCMCCWGDSIEWWPQRFQNLTCNNSSTRYKWAGILKETLILVCMDMKKADGCINVKCWIGTYRQSFNCWHQERHIFLGVWDYSTSLWQPYITSCLLLPNVIGLEVAISHKYMFVQPPVQLPSQIYLFSKKNQWYVPGRILSPILQNIDAGLWTCWTINCKLTRLNFMNHLRTASIAGPL